MLSTNGVLRFRPLCTSITTQVHVWHHRLGNPSSQLLKYLCNHIPNFSFSSPSIPCNSCHIDRSHKMPFHASTLSCSVVPLHLNYCILICGLHQVLPLIILNTPSLLSIITLVKFGYTPSRRNLTPSMFLSGFKN